MNSTPHKSPVLTSAGYQKQISNLHLSPQQYVLGGEAPVLAVTPAFDLPYLLNLDYETCIPQQTRNVQSSTEQIHRNMDRRLL